MLGGCGMLIIRGSFLDAHRCTCARGSRVLLGCLLTSGALASIANADHLPPVTPVLPGSNHQHENHAGANYSAANFTGVDFSSANLSDVNLFDATLDGARFNGAT